MQGAAPVTKSERRQGDADSATGILTLAIGPPKYMSFALALANSIRRFGRWEGPLAVVTDSPSPALRRAYDIVLDCVPQRGGGVEQKLSLDQYSPFERTLFIDCDSLVFRGLDDLFELFELPSFRFGVLAGEYIGREGTHYNLNDVGSYLDALGIDRLPAFNSGVLLWDAAGTAVFERARECVTQVASGQFRPFKDGRLSDEPVLGAALEQMGIEYIAPRRELMVPTVLATDLGRLDVVSGCSKFRKLDPEGWVAPAIVHFNFDGQDSFVYARERVRASYSWASSRVIASLACLPKWLPRHAVPALVRRVRRKLRR